MQLEPLAYHVAVADLLQRAEPELWKWFASDAFAEKYKIATDADLLKTAIRLDRTGPNERRYALAEQARDKLGLSVPIKLHQMQASDGAPNACLVYTPGEIVIVFAGRILELLITDAELLDLLGHEISHYKLLDEAGGRFHIVDRLLVWLIQRDNCPAEFFETWRRNRLYTEIYCDIGGLIACGDRSATIAGLVKSIADFKDADAASYLTQARDILALGAQAARSRGVTHPELHVRVLAIAAADQDRIEALEPLIQELISGTIELGALDLIDQQSLRSLSRKLLDRLLGPGSAPSEEALAHARQIFHDYKPPSDDVAPLADETKRLSASTIDYLVYLMLDFGTLDGASSRQALAVAATAADELGCGARFREIARLELKGRRTLLTALTDRAA